MPAIGLHHYNLRAPAPLLAQLRDFYCDLVGLRVGERPPFASTGYWLYAGEQAVLHLSTALDGDIRHTAMPTTFDHAAFACTDFAAMRAKLAARGIAYTADEVPLLKQRQLFFSDPAGNGVELNFTGD